MPCRLPQDMPVPKPEKYAPKHRGNRPPAAPSKVLRNAVVSSGVAVGATSAVVVGGVVLSGGQQVAVAAPVDLDTITGVSDGRGADRDTVVSRSDQRTGTDTLRVAGEVAIGSIEDGYTRTENIRDEDPREIGRALLADFGWSSDQFGCLDSLWTRESGWSVTADNPTSSAYGIPQALPGSKMASAGADWQYNPVTQITWGLGYIQDRYGSPCGAWGHSQSVGWY